jgi:hypothetical protein
MVNLIKKIRIKRQKVILLELYQLYLFVASQIDGQVDFNMRQLSEADGVICMSFA